MKQLENQAKEDAESQEAAATLNKLFAFRSKLLNTTGVIGTLDAQMSTSLQTSIAPHQGMRDVCWPFANPIRTNTD